MKLLFFSANTSIEVIIKSLFHHNTFVQTKNSQNHIDILVFICNQRIHLSWNFTKRSWFRRKHLHQLCIGWFRWDPIECIKYICIEVYWTTNIHCCNFIDRCDDKPFNHFVSFKRMVQHDHCYVGQIVYIQFIQCYLYLRWWSVPNRFETHWNGFLFDCCSFWFNICSFHQGICKSN